MFVISPVSALHSSASRPHYSIRNPYDVPRPSARDRYLAAVAQAEAEYARDQVLERQRAREAYARRQHREQFRRQLVLDALQAQADGYCFCPVAWMRPCAHGGYADERAERLGRATLEHEWKRSHSEEGSGSRSIDVSVHQQTAGLGERQAPVEGAGDDSLKRTLEARLMECESDMKDTLRSLIESIRPTPSAAATSAVRTDTKGKSKQVSVDSETESEPDTMIDASAIEASLSAISDIDTTFRAMEKDFELPAELDFISSDDGELKLAYSSRNAPLLFYDNGLSQLLSRLDGVASYGSKEVREARKRIVGNVSAALEQLETDIQKRKELPASTSENAEEAVPEPEVPLTSAIEAPGSTAETLESVAEPPETVARDSSAVPLIAGPVDDEPAATTDAFSESIPPVASEEDTWSEIEA